MNTVQYRGIARIFPEVHTIFKSPYRPSPPPPPANSKSDRQKHSHWRNCAVKTGLSENNMFTFHTILLAICVHLKVYHLKVYHFFIWKPTFWCGRKESVFWKTDLQVWKKQTVHHFILPSLLFNVYSLFYFVLFHLFFTVDLYALAYFAYR